MATETKTTPLRYLTSYDEYVKVREEAKGLVAIIFTASWCGPCKRITPDLEKLAQEHKDVDFYKVDVDELDDVSKDASVEAMPTIKIYRGLTEIAAHKGASMKAITEVLLKAKAPPPAVAST